MRNARGSRRRLSVLLPAAAVSLTLLLAPALPGAPQLGLVPGADTVAAAPGTAAAATSKPNIVMVMADDMRADDLRWAPAIRQLIGKRGLTFENSFAPYPLCCPARASFLTGQFAHNHHVYWHERPFGYGSFDDSKTLATSLRGAGYRTGFIGKYLNRYGQDRSKVSGRPSWKYVPRGWDDWRGALDNPPVRSIHGSTYDYMDTPFLVNGKVDNKYKGRYQSYVIGDFSLDMSRRFSRGSKPFFMYVNYVAPHFGGPNEADDPPTSLVDDKGYRHDFRTPARPPGVRGKFDRVITRSSGMPRGGGPSERHIGDKPRYLSRYPEPNARERLAMREMTRQRAESIFVMDQQVARLIRDLKKRGEWSNTVFMFTSDNGYYLGEHRRRSGKVRAHEPSLRVPFVVTGPGMRSGAKRYDPITTVDLAATILDFGKAKAPRRADGTSRRPTMLRGDQGWTVPVLTEATHTEGYDRQEPGFTDIRTAIGVRTARFSLLRNRSGQHELYDLKRDPLQNINLYGDPRYRNDRRRLENVWWKLRNCAGNSCQKPLPDKLSAGPQRQRDLGERYWKVVRDTYGF